MEQGNPTKVFQQIVKQYYDKSKIKISGGGTYQTSEIDETTIN